MLGIWGEHARLFLLLVMASTTLVFALPLFLVPLRWARLLGWRIPADTDLAQYFGRCLGAFILVVEALMLRAALTGVGLHFTFEVVAMVALLMAVVHVRGALQRIQPLSETLEIGMYGALLLFTLLFWPP